jgi:DNA replication protein DnaD
VRMQIKEKGEIREQIMDQDSLIGVLQKQQDSQTENTQTMKKKQVYKDFYGSNKNALSVKIEIQKFEAYQDFDQESENCVDLEAQDS